MTTEISADRLGFLLSDVTRFFRAAFEREIARAGLGITAGEARALVRIAARKGARQSEIAVELGIEPMTLSRYVDGLERSGLVARRADPDDRRAKCVETTDAADAVLDQIRALSDTLIERLEAGLDAAEKATLRKALKTMRDNFANL
ncbi:MarR family winged helix-turn-helix transcriptional regulator [Martelella limonii]|uniref:MarR family winged helix-turn-helix transcriptional regulator n=1 Tax=Martelella limonii TaxID=1647649 RepID=UPI00158014E5|nr:MarR family transcriptional regulator [Martelella limonii]